MKSSAPSLPRAVLHGRAFLAAGVLALAAPPPLGAAAQPNPARIAPKSALPALPRQPGPQRPAALNATRHVPGQALVKLRASPGGITPRSVRLPAGVARRKSFSRTGWLLVQTPRDTPLEQTLETLRRSPHVQHAEPNYRYHLAQLGAAPNDPLRAKLWGLDKIGATSVWSQTTGGTDVVVAVVDTGVDYRHPDLAANMWRNPGEIAGNNLDDDQNGYVDDIHGIDVLEQDGDPMDDFGHGTHVAGTIGAVGGNGVGVTGINWTARIMALRVGAGDRFADSASIAEALEYAVEMKARGVPVRVANHSWGGPYPSLALAEAFCMASDAGILNVCAAGNDTQDTDAVPQFPACYDCSGILSVAASDSADAPAGFSNYGRATVHLAAPGVEILSTYKGGAFYADQSGTSMASPHVAGAALWLLTQRPELTLAQLKQVLLSSVDALPAWRDCVASGGRLNLARAADALRAGAASGFTPPQASAHANNANAGPPSAPHWSAISRNRDGRLGNGASYPPSLSADGRFVAFASAASNFVPGDQAGKTDIFILDRLDNARARVTRGLNGSEADGDSDEPFLSGDGRFVVFTSTASNLVAGDTNGVADVFLYDRVAARIELVSVPPQGGLANGPSGSAVVSADGAFVAFVSAASNLSPDDANNEDDVFLRARPTSTTERISVNDAGTGANADSGTPAISGDGRWVVFHSRASNLVARDTNLAYDIFLRDRQAGAIERLSVNSRGEQAFGDSVWPVLSADGQTVAFASTAANLDTGISNNSLDVFVHDRTLARTRRISVGNAGEQSNADCLQLSISHDGHVVAFVSAATTLLPLGAVDLFRVYLYDRRAESLAVAAHNAQGYAVRDNSFVPALSGNGRYLALSSWTFNLVPGDGNAQLDVFLLDRGEQRPDLSVRSRDGSAFAGEGLLGANIIQRAAQDVAPAATARYEVRLLNAGATAEAFLALADPLPSGWTVTVSDPQTGAQDIAAALLARGWQSPPLEPGARWRLDVTVTAPPTGQGLDTAELFLRVRTLTSADHLDAVRMVSSRPSAPPTLVNISRNSSGAPGDGPSRGASLSSDAQRIAFSSEAENLAPGDANMDSDVFLADRAARGVTLISTAADGTRGNSRSRFPSLSGDGRWVAFQSYSDNLAEGPDANDVEDVFLKEPSTGRVRRLSSNPQGQAGNRGSEFAEINDDGQFVVFQSFATNLVAGDTNGVLDIFLYDRGTERIECLSRMDNGAFANADSENPSITGNGRFILFDSFATNLASGDDNGFKDVYLYDRMTRRHELISATSSGRAGNGPSSASSITEDGRFVVFGSGAEDLRPGFTAEDAGMLLLDRTTRSLTPVRAILTGLPSGMRIGLAVISPDGRWVGCGGQVADATGRRVSQVFVGDRVRGTVVQASATAAGISGADPSQGARFSADGRFLVFRSWAQNLVGEHTFPTSQALLYDQAVFQPDTALRRGEDGPWRGVAALPPDVQFTEQLAAGPAAASITFRVLNAAPFEDHFRVTALPHADPNWSVTYLETATGIDLTSALLGDGWVTRPLPAGGSVELRASVQGNQSVTGPVTLHLTAASEQAPRHLDAVIAVVRPDLDRDALPDDWERLHFGDSNAATGAGDADSDGFSNRDEYLAQTSPRDPTSLFRIHTVERLDANTIRIRWQSQRDSYYRVEETPALAQPFLPTGPSAPGTPPENVFIQDTTSAPGPRFFRIRAEVP